MAFRDGNATEIPTVTIHSGKLRSIDAVTEMQLRSVRHDSYDQFDEIFSFQYLQYPTLPLQFLTSKKSIGPMTLSMRNMDGERGAVLTQSAKVCTHRVRRPPFWLIVTALDRNRYLPVSKRGCMCGRPHGQRFWTLTPSGGGDMEIQKACLKFTMLWRLVYAYVTIGLFIVV